MISYVTKRDGSVVEFDAEKLNQWSIWASNNCNIRWSDIVFGAIRKVYDKIPTTDLQKALIETCLEKRTDGHTKMAANLLVGVIYKEAFGDFSIPHLKDYYHEMVEDGWWIDMGYTDTELDYLDTVIDHTRDFTYSYATLKQFADKYGIKSFGRLVESPQMTFIGVAMANMVDEENRLESIRIAYEKLSMLKINLPTPTVSLERTPSLPAPSCCVISGDDTVDSIGAASHIAYTMTAKSSGIGVELRTRAPKDPVKNGRIAHGGKYSYYSYLDRAVKSNKQAVRGGSATVTFHSLDPEVLELLTLKQQRTDPSYRLDHMDYSLAVNHLFLRKAAKNEQWMLVSPYFAKELWDLSYSGDQEAFEAEYERVLKSSVKKTMIPARDIIAAWVKARGDTGRVYITYLDNINGHTPFKDPIRLSNLCQEVLLPTKGYEDVKDLFGESDGEVALCNLGSIVVSNIEDDKDYEETAYILCKITDNTIEKGVYPFPQVEKTAKSRRSIGIGMTDLAHLMAKNDLKYDTEQGRNFIHTLAEKHSFFLHKASIRLAEEKGRCEWFNKTKYADGWLPIDTYSQSVDEHHSEPLHMPWEDIRDGVKSGVRFNVLEAYMPTESSSLLTNSCNGVYPVRKTEIFKSSPKGSVYFRAPDFEIIDYQNAYDIDHLDMVKVYSIIQKFTGQGISADFYSVVDGDTSKLSLRAMLQRILFAGKMGMKTFYYENFKTEAGEAEQADVDCDGCKL